jgi:hypothetical protein
MKRPDTSLVFVGAFLAPWGAAASTTADSWLWRITDLAAALAGAWALRTFAVQCIAWSERDR